MGKDKITRGLTWLRRALEIKVSTRSPDTLGDEIKQVLDAFGWSRYLDADSATFSGVNVAAASMGVVAENSVRLILSAGVESSSSLTLAFNFSMTVGTQRGGQQTALQRPFITNLTDHPGLVVGMQNPVVLGPGDNFSVTSRPATGVGETLIGRIRFIDLPVGEYVLPRA